MESHRRGGKGGHEVIRRAELCGGALAALLSTTGTVFYLRLRDSFFFPSPHPTLTTPSLLFASGKSLSFALPTLYHSDPLRRCWEQGKVLPLPRHHDIRSPILLFCSFFTSFMYSWRGILMGSYEDWVKRCPSSSKRKKKCNESSMDTSHLIVPFHNPFSTWDTFAYL